LSLIFFSLINVIKRLINVNRHMVKLLYKQHSLASFYVSKKNIMTAQIHVTTLKDKYPLLSQFIDSVVSNISVTNMSQQRTYHNYKELQGFKVLILKYVKLQRDTQPLITILCH